jgi:hypothetical protein
MLNIAPPAQSDPIPADQSDFMADTFAKFGLNMNLYQPGEADTGKTSNKVVETSMEPKLNKIDKLVRELNIPDFGFLTDDKVHM